MLASNARARRERTYGGMATTRSLNARTAEAVASVLERMAALPAGAGDAVPDRLAVVGDYLAYWLDHERGPVLSLGSIERYVLTWCEDPTESVIDTLIHLRRLASQSAAHARPWLSGSPAMHE